MKLLIIILLFCSCSPLVTEVIIVVECDSLLLERYYAGCVVNSINDFDSFKISKLKRADCVKEARDLYCKPVKYVQYLRGERVLKVEPAE